MIPTAEDVIGDLAEHIHRTVEIQGWGCYHLGAGLACCIGLARSIFKTFDVYPKPDMLELLRENDGTAGNGLDRSTL